MPFPNALTVRRDLFHKIAPDAPFRGLGPRLTALYPVGILVGDKLPSQIQRVTVRQAARIMVLGMIDVLPDQIPVPVIFADKSAAAVGNRAVLRALFATEQIAVIEQLSETPHRADKNPAMNLVACHIQQVDFVVRHRRQDRKSHRRLGRIVDQQSCLNDAHVTKSFQFFASQPSQSAGSSQGAGECDPHFCSPLNPGMLCLTEGRPRWMSSQPIR